MNICHYSAAPNFFWIWRKAEKLATFISSLSIELLSHDSCTRMTPVLWYSLLRRRLRRSSILFSKDLAFSEISDGMESLHRDWLRRATCQPRRCLLGALKNGNFGQEELARNLRRLGRRSDDSYQKFAVWRKSNRWLLWSWDTEARMKKKQSNDPRREEAEEKQGTLYPHWAKVRGRAWIQFVELELWGALEDNIAVTGARSLDSSAYRRLYADKRSGRLLTQFTNSIGIMTEPWGPHLWPHPFGTWFQWRWL